MDYGLVVERLRGKGCYSFKPAAEEDVQFLVDHQFSEVIVAFYRNYEPRTICDPDKVFEGIRLYSIQEMVFQTTEMDPGASLAPYSFYTIASNRFGDCYLMDGREEKPEGGYPIVYADHEMFGLEVAADEVEGMIKKVANSLYEFLEMVERGEIEEE